MIGGFGRDRGIKLNLVSDEIFTSALAASIENPNFPYILPLLQNGPSVIIIDGIPAKMPELNPLRELIVIVNSTTVLQFDKETSLFVNAFPTGIQPNMDPLSDPRLRNVTVSTFNCSAFSYFSPLGPNGKPDWAEGLEFNLWNELSQRYNLNWKIKEAKEFGGLRNGTWSPGTNRDLVLGLADIGFCSIWLVTGIVEYVEPVVPWHLYCLRFLVPRPTSVKIPSWNTLTKSYSNTVWICFIATMLITAVTYRILLRSQYLLLPQHSGSRKYEGYFHGLADEVLQTLTHSEYPKDGPMKPLVFCWSIGTLLFSVGYSSDLVSVLTSGLLSQRLTTVKDIVEAGCVWGLNTYEENDYIYEKDEEEVYKTFRSRYLGPNITLAEKKKAMQSGCYAELVESAQG